MNENTRQATEEARRQQQPVATRTRRSSNTSSISTTGHHHQEVSSPREQRHHGLNLNRVESLNHNISDSSMDAFTTEEIATILEKEESERNLEEIKILKQWSFLVPDAKARIRAKLAKSVIKQRSVEREESMESIENKADVLAMLIREANYTVIYTGAGISTSASIPDYRGPNGLWTQIKKTGTFSITKIHDLSAAEPTLTHMAIKELCRRRMVNHVVSQNCDGLHLRSGIPQKTLSEIHGNMFIEVCPSCEKQYYRQADVTERTSRFRHKTGRKCHTCAEPNNNLIDTIVLYGERSKTQWPMNWERAGKAAKKADLIICMGSSLKTLRRYFCLWPERVNREPKTKLVIINLQYTSKDKNAVLKINGRCDLVMNLVMKRLNIEVPTYDWSLDPLNQLAIPFTPEERNNLKRNLIFETKARQSLKRELSQSPSLFVSEITDDPDKKRLRMRIRARDADGTSVSPTGSSSTTNQDLNESPSIVKQEQEMIKEEVNNATEQLHYAIPGWLGKSLGASRSTSYKRKRHGNKGRKHSTALKQQQAADDDLDLEPLADQNSDKTPAGDTDTASEIEIDFLARNEKGAAPISVQRCSLEVEPASTEASLKIINQET